jgi:uncharacterized small protein (DUF1192 family)
MPPVDDEDVAIRRPSQPAPFRPRDLAALSVGELTAYIDQLRAEIARAEAEINARQSVRGAAEALFKRG